MAGQVQVSGFDLDSKAFEKGLAHAISNLKLSGTRELNLLGYDAGNRMRRYAPVDTGRLRAATGVKGRGVTHDGAYIDVGVAGVVYADDVEYGTRPHVIRVKRAKVLANRKTGQVFGAVVHHPGTDPQPFVRPGLLEAVANWRPKIEP